MKSPLPIRSEPVRVDLLRDDVRIVERHGGDLAALRKALATSRRLRREIPFGAVDSVAEVRAIRDSGGHA